MTKAQLIYSHAARIARQQVRAMGFASTWRVDGAPCERRALAHAMRRKYRNVVASTLAARHA